MAAGAGGFGYLREPVWWMGMLAMIFGELANFAAYAFAPAIIVTPLGAFSILVSAVLAHYLLKEKLNIFGVVGCVLCCVGAFVIVLHAPEERKLGTIKQVRNMSRLQCILKEAMSFSVSSTRLIILPSSHKYILIYAGYNI